ncbi:MAG: hypothetical protein ACPHIA_07995 [Alphaproteobacteria bacterium]
MTKFLEFPNEAAALLFARHLAEDLGYCEANGAPTEKAAITRTYHYTTPALHPTDGRAICAIDTDAHPYLSQAELLALKQPEEVAEFFRPQGA